VSDEKKKGFVPTRFKDAGTGEIFEGGKEHSFDPGAYQNYLAAGLIGDRPAAKGKADAADASKPAA
jgi:hypothetical protein